MGDYYDLYLITDFLLLGDVFEQLRKMCLRYYKLDPCHCFSSPGLSWHAILNIRSVKLDLSSNFDAYQFIKKRYGMRSNLYSTKIQESQQ